MATVYNPHFNTENQEKDRVNAPQTLGGGGATTPNARMSTGPQGQSQQGTGQAPNIQDYLKANIGGGERIRSGIEANIQGQASQASQNLQKSQQQLESQVQPLEQELGSQAQNVIQSSFKNPEQLMNAYQASQKPNAATDSNQQNLINQYNEFQRLRQGQPLQDISKIAPDQSAAQQNLQKIQQASQLSRTEPGQFQLLQQTFGNPKYTSGQQMLDQLLLQSQPNAAKGLQQNLQKLSGQVGQQFNESNTANQARLDALKNMATNLQGNIQSELTGNLQNIQSNVEKEYANALKQQAAVPDIAQRFANAQLTPEELKNLGLMTDQKIYDLYDSSNPDYKNLSQYIIANPLARAEQGGYAQVASPEEFARYQALNQLAGNTAGIFGSAPQSITPYSAAQLSPQLMENIQNREKYYTQELPKQLMNAYAKRGGNIFNDLLQQMEQDKSMTGSALGQKMRDILQANLDSYYKMYNEGGAGVMDDPASVYNDPLFKQAYGYLDQIKNMENRTFANAQKGLPTSSTGDIDWSQIQRPRGK